MLDILEELPTVEEVTGKEQTVFDGASAENVTFSYEAETILDGMSLQITNGKIIGLTGKSGSVWDLQGHFCTMRPFR